MPDPLRQRVLAAFNARFDAAPAAWVRAPGRVNLIGEHTDYNGGFVLPCAIGFQTVIALRPRSDARVRVVACDFGHAEDDFRLDEPIVPAPQQAWANYVRGVLKMLVDAGHAPGGADIVIAGDVPQGAGLSSSAALEVALARAFAPELTAAEAALLAQRAENDFVGVRCGIMDQLISAAGVEGHALLIDCRSLHTRPVPLPTGSTVLIVHSHVKRGLVGSEYNLRRQQCEAAARHYGVAALRELAEADLATRPAGLDDVAWRRARHIVTENARTLAAAEALAAGDLAAMGRLMAASHASMRDDFEITVPAMDRLVQLLQEHVGPAGGARMTGGGFGGCAVALLPSDRADAVQAAVERDYRAPDGSPGTVWRCSAAAGAGPWPAA